MLTLHLVRHGQTDFNAEGRVQGQFDSRLDEVGKQQAQFLQMPISMIGITAAYTSSNLRAVETAEILTEGLQLPLHRTDELREIFMGPWQQRLWSEVAEENQEQFANFMTSPDRFSLEGAESFVELRERGVRAIESIIATESEGEVLVVSHGAILKAIVSHYANVDLARMWEDPSLKNCSHSTMLCDAQGKREILTLAGTDTAGTIWQAK